MSPAAVRLPLLPPVIIPSPLVLPARCLQPTNLTFLPSPLVLPARLAAAVVRERVYDVKKAVQVLEGEPVEMEVS